ncbi:putative pentatricopeptide [Medicago truncatula]|uniref:Putative pentatricopeptide n=1 Tax=Medicago truncatula TaxID=3880 RepID=A0A396K4H3_MEDTR|nr:putative pentatricopeptide [Medicago truncatula]
MMEKENVKPSPYTYKILIDVKGMSNDIDGISQIVRTMKAEGVEPDHLTWAVLARHYASAGLIEKTEAILKVTICGLKKIEEAEAVFGMMSIKWKLIAQNYLVLLKIYTRHKMLDKGKDLIKKMEDSGCIIGPIT